MTLQSQESYTSKTTRLPAKGPLQEEIARFLERVKYLLQKNT